MLSAAISEIKKKINQFKNIEEEYMKNNEISTMPLINAEIIGLEIALKICQKWLEYGIEEESYE